MELLLRILSTLAAGLCFSTFSTTTASTVNYDKTINVGDPLEFNVLSQLPDIGYCRFVLPNVDGNQDNIESGFITGDPIINGEETDFIGRPQVLGADTWKYQWIEASKERCHIKIKATIAEDSGVWSYSTTGLGDDDSKNILVQVAPDKVTPGFSEADLTFEYTKEEDQEEEVLPLISKELIFYCKNGNPMPTIKLYLGGSEITESVTIETEPIFANETRPDDGSDDINQDYDNKPDKDVLFTAKTTFNYTAMPEDDSKTLLYECSHPVLENPMVINETITVKAPPSANDFVVEGALGGKVGDPVTLELTFHANPEPKQIKWYMHDLDAYLMVPDLADIVERPDVVTPEQNEINETRYEFSNTTKDGNRYTARMIVTKLEGNDEGKNTFIEVDNGNGLHNYTITYMELDAGMSGGVIAGIVIGVLLGLLILGALGFLLFKKKGKILKKKQKQNSPEFHNPEPTPRSAPGNVTVEMEQSTQPAAPAEDVGHDNPAHQTE